MQFDIRTLLVTVALATTFCAAARFLLWRMHPHVPGLAHWAWAGVLGACALFLFAGWNIMPDSPSLSLAQALIAAGLMLAWDGFRRFLNRPPLKPWLALPMLAALLVPIVVAHVQLSLVLRSVANAAVMSGISALICYELLRPGSPIGAATRTTAYLYMANAVFFLIRAGIAMTDGALIGQPQSTGFTAMALLWWLCVTVAVTLGMALMTSERLQEDLDLQASRDPLTGALNRRAFALVADKMVARARRNDRPLSVLMMDLDHFKQINDQLGHAAGDDILCRFVAAAGRVLRGEDVFCRFGGEEFVALLPDSDVTQALAAAERLRAAYADDAAQALPPTLPQPFPFTVSVGVGQLQPEEELESALRRADTALYLAKASGRNRCEIALAPSQQVFGDALSI